MSYTPFKEVTVANPGSTTRYGSDDLLDVMKIFNSKVVSNKRPEIINPWRWSSWQEIKQVTEASVTTPTEANVVHLFQSATDNHLKVKKTGGTIVDLENVGSGTWSPSTTETLSNKTINIDTNLIKHSTTNAQGDILRYDSATTRYIRLAKGTANQLLAVNAAGTDLEWQVPPAGGGGGGETNTASNVGSAGIGLFYQKLGVDLQFKSIFSPDASVLISDDTGNQKVDITLGSGIVKINATNTFGDFQNTFRSSRLAIANPANSFAYFFVASALAASRNITLPLLTANDQMTTDNFTTTLLNKTLGSGTVANTDTITLKHSTTNNAGDLLVSTGTKYDRFARGTADQVFKMNPSGTGVEWGSATGGGVKMPDGTTAPSTGRWGLFYGGAVQGMGMMGFHKRYFRVHGTTTSTSESVTNIYADSGVAQIAEFKTAVAFRRDSSCVFKAKWQATSTSGCKIKIGLSDATDLPAGGSGQGTSVIRYDISQNGSGHLEFDGPSRFGVRVDAGAGGLNEAVTEVVVRFRKYGTPSGSATVGIRKNSDGSLISLGTFTPNSFGSGEQTTTISAGSNTYLMVNGDRVTVEFPSNSTDGMELDEDTNGAPSGFTCQSYTGSWANESSGIGMRIKTAPSTAGNLGDTPLINANGVMV